MMKKILLTIFIAFAIPAYGNELAIVVNKNSPIKSISMKDVKSIFTGEKAKWSDGRNIVVVDYKRNVDMKKNFCEKILKMSQIQLYKRWIKASLLGKGSQIVLVSTQQEVIDRLNKDPESVGYVDRAEIKNSNLKKLQVIK